MAKKVVDDIRQQLTNYTSQQRNSGQSTTSNTQSRNNDFGNQAPIGTPNLNPNPNEARTVDDGSGRVNFRDLSGNTPTGGVGEFGGGQNRTVDEGGRGNTLVDDVSRRRPVDVGQDRNDGGSGSGNDGTGRDGGNRTPPQRHNLVIRIVGDSGSATMIVNKVQQFVLKSGDNQFQLTYGDDVSIATSNSKKFKVGKITKITSDGRVEEKTSNTKPKKTNGKEVSEEVETAAPKQKKPVVNTEVADVNETSQFSSTFKVTSDLGIIVEVETIQEKEIKKPKVVFAQPDADRRYDIESDVEYPILLKRISGDVDILSAVMGNQRFNFDTSKIPQSEVNNSDFVMLVIPPTFFKSVKELGFQRLEIIPSTKDKVEGEPIETRIKLFTEKTADKDDKDYIPKLLPDITKISYPAKIEPADYVGLDVDFEIKWKSENTEYVRVYVGPEKYKQEQANGSVTFNFKELILSQNVEYSEDENEISIVLRLVPFNEKEGLKGQEEFAKISLLKSKYTIPRTDAIQRLADAFASQLDVNVFRDTTSKHLTHLLHINPTLLIANWTGSGDSLIVKLYEPLPTSIQLNSQAFITKLQSTPIIETVTISGFEEQYCQPLKGPNFTLEPDNGIGYRYFDELVASGSLTSTDLVNRYMGEVGIDTTNLNIQYVSGSEYLFENFVNFGSAKERTTNFLYKVELLESYINKFNSLITTTTITGSITTEDGFQLITELGDLLNWQEIQSYVNPSEFNESGRIVSQINEIIRGFDGWENFLYKSTNDLSYPKTTAYYPHSDLPIYSLKLSTSSEVQSWYESIIVLAENYDRFNPNYLNNNLPEFLTTDPENNDFILFMDMIGQHFDIIWAYINGINRAKSKAESAELGIPNELVWYFLKSFGWEGKRAFDSQFLWEYAFGENKDGTQKYGMSLEEANNQIWRRIINNLPYLLKHKGTSRAMKAIMACYGVPQSLLTIMEFGGPQDPTKGGVTQFTFDDRTAAIHLQPSSSIIVPFDDNSIGYYPQALEFRFKPDVVKTTRIISASQFSIDIVQTTGSFARLDLVFGQGSASPYIEDITTTGFFYYYTSSVSESFGVFPSGSGLYSGSIGPYISPEVSGVYVLGPTEYTASLDFPLSTENYSTILVNKHQYAGFDGMYEVLLRTTDGQRITTAVSMSFRTDSRFWDSGSQIIIGNDFSGELDEVRLWTEPLSRSKFDNHALFPDAINGNQYNSSTEHLLFRLDFEYPKDVTKTENSGSKNVAINSTYGHSYASASNFYSASTYPYQYVPYDRIVTANVPSLGMNYANKIRFEEQFNINGGSVENGVNLSHKVRATQKSFDKAPIDSSRLGLFFSPIKELNMDILKAFGDFNIDNYIGDPSDDYRDSYKELEGLRTYYFERLDRNINEYIRLVKYIDKSLFDVLADLAPARAKISKGLLIEPHYLERSKTRWDRPVAQKNNYDTSIDTNEDVNVESSYHTYTGILDGETDLTLTSEISNNQGIVEVANQTELVGEPLFYSSLIDYSVDDLLEGSVPSYETTVYVPTGSSLVGEADSFKSEVIGLDPNSLSNRGFGIYAENGTGIYKYYDIFGNLTGSRQNIFLVKEQYQKKIKTQTAGWPTIGALPGESVVFEDVVNTFERFKVSLLPFSGSVTVGNDIVEVKPLNGYFPTHYKFVNNLSEGMKLSFFKGSKQTASTTPDGLPPVESFTTNPNILRVAKTGRGSGEPILEVD